MAEDEFVFASAVEGLYLRGLRDRLTPELKIHLRGIGIDLDHVLPAYALEVWEAALRTTAGALFPDRALDDGLHELGRMLIDGYQHTAIGRALFPLMRLLGPARVLARLSRNLQTANNYTQTRFNALGPNQAELWVSRVIQPAFYRGLLEAGLRASGAAEPVVELGARDGPAFTFHIRWG